MLNDIYQNPNTIKKIQKVFKKEGKVILFDILEKSAFKKIKDKILKLKFTKDVQPLSHSYETSTPIHVDEIKTLVKTVANKAIQSFTAFSFTWKDYTILNDNTKEKPGIDIILDLTDFTAGGEIVYQGETSIPPKANSLIIVQRNTQRYVQYVNHKGKGRRRIFLIATVPDS